MSSLSDRELRRAERRHDRREEVAEDLENRKADVLNAIEDLLDTGDTDTQRQIADLVEEFTSRVRTTMRLEPSTTARSLTLDEFMSVATGTAPAALGSGTGSTGSASTAPTLPPEIESILRALAEFTSHFGMDPLPWLTGPGAHLVRIVDQNATYNVTALNTHLREMANAAANQPNRLLPDGELQIHRTAEDAERDRDELDRILRAWLPNIDALRRLTGTTLRARKDAVAAAAEGRTDPRVSDLTDQLRDANGQVSARNQVLDDIAQAIAVAQVRERGRNGNDIEVLALQPRQLSSEAVAALRARRVPRV